MPEATTIGPYRVIRPLGQGGMGMVYEAEGPAGVRVALKTVRLVRGDMLQGLRREIAALARLRHPGIVSIVDEGVEEGLPWYAMDLHEGKTLRRVIRDIWSVPLAEDTSWTAALDPTRVLQDPVLSTVPLRAGALGQSVRRARDEGPKPQIAGGRLEEALRLVRRLCLPLAYLHGEGMVHRDLKPENVLVKPDGSPVLLDFGLMAQATSDGGRETLQVAGDVTGTVSYMAPEQCLGELPDARADLYSLGCMLYELLTGGTPFFGESVMEVFWKHQREEPPPPSLLVDGVPRALDSLAMRLLAKDPSARLGYAELVAAELEGLGAPNGSPHAPRPRPYLYRPRLAGREEILRELAESIEGLPSRGGRLVAVEGSRAPERRDWRPSSRSSRRGRERWSSRESASYLRLAPESVEKVRARNELGHRVLQRRRHASDVAAHHVRALEEARRLGDREGEEESLRSCGCRRRWFARARCAPSRGRLGSQAP